MSLCSAMLCYKKKKKKPQKFIDFKQAKDYLKNIFNTIKMLSKWNGHLYNWYTINTLEPLKPRYISTVDSGNFVRIHVYS